MSDTLYIIGNGFDLHHGMRTSYIDFRDDYAKKKSYTWNTLQDLYGYVLKGEMWWSDFEVMLAKVDYRHLMKTWNGMALGPTRVRGFLKYNLPVLFGEWISHVDDNVEPDPLLEMDPGAQYLTFNYTMTLEKVYDIDNKNVWHIHNSLTDIRDGRPPVVGHDSDEGQLLSQLQEQRQLDSSIPFEIADDINTQISGGKKDVQERIRDHEEDFYTRYSHIRNYVSMGFSFNDIDMPYIEKIVVVNLCFSEADWLFYYHSDEDVEKLQGAIQRLGINPENVRFKKW